MMLRSMILLPITHEPTTPSFDVRAFLTTLDAERSSPRSSGAPASANTRPSGDSTTSMPDAAQLARGRRRMSATVASSMPSIASVRLEPRILDEDRASSRMSSR